ncbi:MAG: undecaprenyldiphospho-muramoylpentapeptide beta-N-acetylglucosaminyltransferase [Candidatus Eremiobacteraeota bacterium]|nr:undecaprenyldiphospho-muramoylpentapeptide beta-N-acetylglucosaminyltransferase [Candidatus Eremiobacteraeota bacterium]
MRIIITGGGTGGHIYPAIAVAQEIKKRRQNIEIIFIGTQKGIEAKAVPAAGFPIKHINAAPMSSKPLKLLKFMFGNSTGLLQAVSILISQKPVLVIGSGGYVSAPVIAAASILGIPTILLEQNVLPGKTNRFLSKFAQKVLISFEESKKYLPQGKAVLTGNPIRREIIERNKEEALSRLNLSPDKFTLLITGASQGARSINEAVVKSLPVWKDREWQIIHLVGRKNFEDVKKATDPILPELKGEYRCVDYTEDMASVYAVADLVAARAGASTLAEITAVGIASILIPYPYAADNHQEKNARCVEKCGGSIVIMDGDVREKLADEVMKLAQDSEKRQSMANCSKEIGKPEALESIMGEIDELL